MPLLAVERAHETRAHGRQSSSVHSRLSSAHQVQAVATGGHHHTGVVPADGHGAAGKQLL